MTTSTAETTPPCTCDDDDEDDTPSTMIQVSVVGPDERGAPQQVSAQVHVYDDAEDGAPDRFAEAVLSAALGCARARGGDFAWALTRVLDAYRAGQ